MTHLYPEDVSKSPFGAGFARRKRTPQSLPLFGLDFGRDHHDPSA